MKKRYVAVVVVTLVMLVVVLGRSGDDTGSTVAESTPTAILVDTQKSVGQAATPEPSNTPSLANVPSMVKAQVVEVIDGDTIKVLINGQEFTVRYIGIDTPETEHPNKPIEWMGPEASAVNADLVGGKTVLLERDVSETDQYGRLLRYVYVEDIFVNEELVRLGYAQVSTYPPDVKYADLFVDAQQGAREAERGLWTAPSTPAPVELSQPTEPPAAVCDCSGDTLNCSRDFSTHAAAQACYDYCMQAVGYDVHKLDGNDNDGLACELLP